MKRDKRLLEAVKKLIESSFKDGKLLADRVQKNIKLLKSLPKYQAIEALSEYHKGLKREIDNKTLIIVSADDIPNSDQKKIRDLVAKNKDVYETRFVKDNEVIGGFLAQLGDTIYDFTLKNRINQVKEAIAG